MFLGVQKAISKITENDIHFSWHKAIYYYICFFFVDKLEVFLGKHELGKLKFNYTTTLPTIDITHNLILLSY